MAQFTNQAQLTYNNTVTNSNVAVGEILEVLSATKTAVGNTYGPQDNRVTYIISIINSGTTEFSNITVTDNLGSYTAGAVTVVPLTYRTGTVRYYINGVLQNTPAVTPESPLTISGISIPAGGNATIVYEADINQYAPLATGSTIENTVTITSPGITPITASETIAVETEPVLSITKTISPVPVTENGTLTYTFLIQNTGNTAATAEDLAAITDTFNPILNNLTVTFNGDTWAETTNYTYDPATGLFSTVAGQITVPAAAYTQDAATGVWSVIPGTSTLVITGTL